MQSRLVIGQIFNIQRYCVHDGQGIRTILFFKGRPLRCRWCSNPESQSFHTELAFNATHCLKKKDCGFCEDACLAHAISFVAGDTLPEITRERCVPASCHADCTERCHAGALKVFGRSITVEEALREIEKDAVFYQRNSGGLTVSGGEPTAQPEFLMELLKEAESRYLNTAMETCGYAPYEILREVAAHLDTFIIDLKHLDPVLHKANTGVDNALILDNIKKLSSEFRDLPILIRTPVIPGFNDSEKAVEGICCFIENLEGRRISYELLAYHRLGMQKYTQLGKSYSLRDRSLDKSLMERLKRLATFRLGERFVS